MIGNYIDIDYEKLPKRKTEESPKKEEKDYSSIRKLLNHPQYKDIIGLYRGKSEAKPVAMTQSSGLDSSGGYGRGSQYALPLSKGILPMGAPAVSSADALPMIGAGAGAVAASNALKKLTKEPKVETFRVPSKKDEPPALDDTQGKTKPEDLPEGVESAEPAKEPDKGIEGDVEAAKEPLLQFLDDYGFTKEDQLAIIDILDKGYADLGDDDDVELPENVQSFKLTEKDKQKLLDNIRKHNPDAEIFQPSIRGRELAEEFIRIAEAYLEAKKQAFEKSKREFNEKDPYTQRLKESRENDKRAGDTEYVDKQKFSEKSNADKAAIDKANKISAKHQETGEYPEVEVKESDVKYTDDVLRHKAAAENDARLNQIIRGQRRNGL